MKKAEILRFSLFTVYFLAILSFLSAQVSGERQSTAMEIETLLNTEAVTYEQASRFALQAANLYSEDAFNYAVQNGWLPGNISHNDQAQLYHISRLLMRSFRVSGGLMYSITGSSHYAYRELVYINIIQGRTDPYMLVSGERLIFYVNRLFARQDSLDILHQKQREQRNQTRAAAQNSEEETSVRREALAAEIAHIIEEQHIPDTTVEATDEGVKITLSNIMFLADSAILPNSERIKIQEIARVLISIRGVKLQIAGHTALAGSAEGRQQISQQRAQSVADYLILLGACEAENIHVVGYGSDRPIADNRTSEGMALNRRVEIIILEN